MTEEIQPVSKEIGIMMSQKTVSQPLTARMNFGSPWTDAHNELMTLTDASSVVAERAA